MTRYHQPRIGPDRRVRDRRAPRPDPAAAAPPPPAARYVPWPILLALALALAGAGFVRWTRWAASGSPLDRTEALCREIAREPGDSLAAGMRSEVELRRGTFGPHAAPAAALESALKLDPARVLRRWTQRVGDYDVAVMWVRLPGEDRHTLVVGWIEGTDLALCRFRFPGGGSRLSADEIERGDDLLDRVLEPRNFRARG
jgi:hypothetical protein